MRENESWRVNTVMAIIIIIGAIASNGNGLGVCCGLAFWLCSVDDVLLENCSDTPFTPLCYWLGVASPTTPFASVSGQ